MSKKQKVSTKGESIFGNSLKGMLDSKHLKGINIKPTVNEPAIQVESNKEKKKPVYRIRGRLLKIGKGLNPVTELYEWPTHLSESDLRLILKYIKKSLCVGGTLKGKNMELQGDQMKRASEYLSKEHYKLVQSGS